MVAERDRERERGDGDGNGGARQGKKAAILFMRRAQRKATAAIKNSTPA